MTHSIIPNIIEIACVKYRQNLNISIVAERTIPAHQLSILSFLRRR